MIFTSFTDRIKQKNKILNKQDFSKNKFNYYQSEAIDLFFELTNQINTNEFSYQSNLTPTEIKFLVNFKKNRPIKIVNVDKNLGIAIMSHANYDKLIDNYSK